VDPSGDNMSNLLTYDISLKKSSTPTVLSNAINEIDGVSEVALIASKTDVISNRPRTFHKVTKNRTSQLSGF